MKRHVKFIIILVLKIGNEGQNPCIDPIQEVDSFERENNESFLHENNYLFNNFNEQNTNSFDINISTGLPCEGMSTLEESEIIKIRKNLMGLKTNKINTSNSNKSEILHSGIFNTSKKKIFFVQNSSGNINNSSTNVNSNISSHSTNNKLNQSCNISMNNYSMCKRGRKKFLFDGVKTEIIDKAFLREFKNYLKKSRNLRILFDELKVEEKVFWNEFLQNNNPPFYFTQNNQKTEYKSFSKILLKFIFSYSSVRQLYSMFVKDREKDFINSIVNKKIKKVDRKMLLFYSLYGKNLHKLYSSDFNLNDLNIEELESLSLNSGGISTSDSLTINTSI